MLSPGASRTSRSTPAPVVQVTPAMKTPAPRWARVIPVKPRPNARRKDAPWRCRRRSRTPSTTPAAIHNANPVPAAIAHDAGVPSASATQASTTTRNGNRTFTSSRRHSSFFHRPSGANPSNAASGSISGTKTELK